MVEPKHRERRFDEPSEVGGRPGGKLLAVPARTNIDEATKRADMSLRMMEMYSRMLQQGLGNVQPDAGETLRKFTLRMMDPEAAFRRAGEAPVPRSFRSVAEARRSLAEDAREAKITPPSVSPSETQGEVDRETARILGWFDPDYLGESIAGRAARHPPVVTAETNAFFDSDDALSSRRGPMDAYQGSGGRYRSGTNHITIREGGHRSPALMSHELLHYLSYIGGGHEMRWRGDGGTPVMPGYISWLHEGLTELHAQQLVREHGERPRGVGYPYETATSFYLQKLVGRDVLRQAYLSGDFTDVRRILDGRLGAGTFERLASARNGLDALTIITGRMGSAGIDFTRWERDPVIASAFVGIARQDERGGP
ncbi:MAG: hypothetical protein AB1324_07860 [Candidatus Micrarchaeota archaeon]